MHQKQSSFLHHYKSIAKLWFPDAITHVYMLRDLMKYRIVEWDTSKRFIDPVRRIEFTLNSGKSNSSEIKDNSSGKVEN